METALAAILLIFLLIWVPVLVFRVVRGTSETASNLYRKANPAAGERYSRRLSGVSDPVAGNARADAYLESLLAGDEPGTPEWKAKRGSDQGTG